MLLYIIKKKFIKHCDGLTCSKTSLKQPKEILNRTIKTLKIKTPYTNLKSNK